MLRKLGIIFLSLSGAFSTQAYAVSNQVFSQGLAVEYELQPNDPLILSKIFFWQISAVCTVTSDAEENPISIKMLRRTGSFNGVPLSAGDTTGLVLHPGDKLNIIAESGSKVELVNMGDVVVRASCATS